MGLFLFIFFLLYGALHFYAFLKLKHAYHIGVKTVIFVAVFMLVMIFAPVVVRMAERANHDSFALYMAYSGYTWMVVLFLFFCISVCTYLLKLCVYLAGLISGSDFSRFMRADRYFFVVPFACAFLITSYGFYEARQIRIQKITIKTPKIQEHVGKLRIVQISDVHIGLILGAETMERIAHIIKDVNPDMLVSTGDLIDGRFNRLETSIEPFKRINPPYGKFAVTGNHEFYAGINSSIDFTERAGFEILRGRGVTIGDIVNIAGVDDVAGVKFHDSFVYERALLAGLPQEKFTILLKHRPLVEQGSVDLFDLQLSGHTHNGQIYPFRYIVKIFFPLYQGFHKLSGKSYIYTSSGTGTWGPPVRFLAPPEITVIELIHSSE
jgi:hypothetical protein